MEDDAAIESVARAHLAQAGIRVSADRIRALSLLMKFKDRARTAIELIQLGNEPGPAPANLTRVYKTLRMLGDKGLVEKESQQA